MGLIDVEAKFRALLTTRFEPRANVRDQRRRNDNINGDCLRIDQTRPTSKGHQKP